MIEFKAKCGHTVRTKDEDAGSVVRCSYCGKETSVPDSHNEELDFLFTEVGESSDALDVNLGAVPGAKRSLFGRRKPSGHFDPFSIVLRMCYAAALFTIVFLVGKEFVLPLFEEGGVARRVAQRVSDTTRATADNTPTRPNRTARPQTTAPGLVSGGDKKGLYIQSVPSGAEVFVIEADKATDNGTIRNIAGCQRHQASGNWLGLADGHWVVEVSLPWSDKRLNDRNLPDFDGFRAFRRAIQDADENERNRLVTDYFIPDGACRVFIHQTSEQVYLVRQFRKTEIRDSRSKGVRALFLPALTIPGRDSFTIETLVGSYIPQETAYNFDKDNVRGELDFHRVPELDHFFVLEALERIGVIPYVTPDGVTRLFKIGLRDGEFTTSKIDDLTG